MFLRFVQISEAFTNFEFFGMKLNVDHKNCIAPMRLILRSKITEKPIDSDTIVSLAYEKLAIAKEVVGKRTTWH